MQKLGLEVCEGRIDFGACSWAKTHKEGTLNVLMSIFLLASAKKSVKKKHKKRSKSGRRRHRRKKKGRRKKKNRRKKRQKGKKGKSNKNGGTKSTKARLKLDLIIVLDATKNTGKDNFKRCFEFVSELTKWYKIGRDHLRLFLVLNAGAAQQYRIFTEKDRVKYLTKAHVIK